MRWHKAVTLAAIATFALAATGCGNRPMKIKGIVTLDGKPVSDAQVQFIPNGDTGREAMGKTDSDGAFTLSTYGTGDGVLRGEYKILVHKLADRALAAIDQNDKAAMQKQMMEIMKKSMVRRDQNKARESLPSVYSDHERTPLLLTIPAPDGKYNLELFSALGANTIPNLKK